MNNYPAYPRVSAFFDLLAQETGRDPRADLVASVDVIPMLVHLWLKRKPTPDRSMCIDDA